LRRFVVPAAIAVVGGGVSGLAVTFHLERALGRGAGGSRVLCLEAGERPGGNIRTSHEDGFTCEWGPNGFLDNEPATLRLVEALGIRERLLSSRRAAAKRFLYRKGRLRMLPLGPGSFLVSDVLSLGGRLRVLAEPFVPGRRDGDDESVFRFASRRIGREAAAVLVDAMVSGIFAGDARRLSLRAAFPKMWTMETEHGSVFRAMLARRRRRRAQPAAAGTPGGPAGPGGTLTSFRDGMQELIDALAAAVGPALRARSRVTRVVDLGTRGYRLQLAEGAPVDAAVVVLACPAWHASQIVEDLDPGIARLMAEIPPAPVAVVHLGYDRTDLPEAVDGFGFLVPRGEGPRILGCLWSSSIFEGRAAPGRVLLTCMIGGAQDPEALGLDDGELLEVARGDLRTAMNLEAAPRFVRIFRHPHGIPQYTLGHPERTRAIESALERHPGLLVCGNSYHGISVNACAAEAPGVAEAAARGLDAARLHTTA
jgi:oxygen-dependent protoporphyrinogen oxidase